MVHGDNSGLVLPPRVASVQVCVGRVLARILNLREVILGVGPVRHEYSYYPHSTRIPKWTTANLLLKFNWQNLWGEARLYGGEVPPPPTTTSI